MAELQALRQELAVAAQARAEKEQHLNTEIEALRIAGAEQLRRIGQATAALQAESEARQQAELEAHQAEQRAKQEADRVAELQAFKPRLPPKHKSVRWNASSLALRSTS